MHNIKYYKMANNLKLKISQAEIDQTNQKLDDFDNADDIHKGLGALKEDPALFAFYSFKDLKGDPFRPFSYQDMILNDPAKKVLLCIARQSGKSITAAIKALHYIFFNDNATVVVVSRTKDQSLELIRKIKVLIASSTIRFKDIYPSSKEGKTEVHFKNRNGKTISRIISVPATDAARGYSADLVICDECAFWENGDYIFNQVIEPMTQFTKGKIMLISTPNGKSGFFWKCFNSDYWSRYQFGWRVCPNNTEEEMEEKSQRMTRMEFEAEYEAKFTTSQNAYFHPQDINNCIDKNMELGRLTGKTNFVVSADFGKNRDHAVIYIGEIENLSDPPEDHRIRVLDRRVKKLGTNYAELIGELKHLLDRYHPSLFVLDATGVGEGPSDVLREYGANVEAVKFSLQSKLNIFSNLRVLFEQKRIRIPDVLEMRNQLELFEGTYTTSGNLLLHAPEGGHDDDVDALGLLAWGLLRIGATPVSAKWISADEKPLDECRHPEGFDPDGFGEMICKTCKVMV